MKRIQVGRGLFLGLAVIFFVCVTTQIFLAGMAIFVSPVSWMHHIVFVHLFGFNLPVFMLIFALIGKMPAWAYWQLFGIGVLIFLMYFTANFTAILPIIGALHPVIALILFLISLMIIVKTWKLVKKEGRK